MDNLFPVSVVDNFFDNPDKVIKLVDSLKFTQSKGFYPGKRTKSLHLLKYDFYHSVICKVLSLFYDLKSTNIRYEDSSMHFQKIKPFNKKQLNHILNKGLVHQDDSVLLAGVIYLDKKPNLNSGTSIYMKTKGRTQQYNDRLSVRKKEIYKINQDKLTKKEIIKYQKLIEDCNQDFTEVIKVNNVYNRLIAYPGTAFHAGNYEVTKERLSLVFFIRKIKSTAEPSILRKNLIKEKI